MMDHQSRRRSVPFALPSLALLAPFVYLQDPAAEAPASRDAARSVERYRDYLSKKPYHDWSFDKLVEAAVSQNKLKELVDAYEQLTKDDPDNRAAKIVLARLYSKGDKTVDAIKLLKSLSPSEPALSKLLGELHLKNNDPKAAVAELENATKQTGDIKFLQEVHRARGKAFLASGDRSGAAAAFRNIASVEPTSFNTRLDVATTLAQHGLQEEAAAEFQEADKLAGNDNSKRCRVLAELGRVQEQQLKIDDALATYRSALALMGRGNWLKSEIQGRILAIHKRVNSFDKLVAEAKNDIIEKPQDADCREFLARVLEEANKTEGAKEALNTAIKDFPDDLRLSRRLLGVLGKLKLKEDLVGEYQRILSRHPEEIDLYLELGKIFAEDKRHEQAKIQWEKLFQQRIKDTDLCVRLAGLYAFYGMEREAIAMHEKAIELQPKEVRHYADFANYLAQRGKTAETTVILEKASVVAAGNASMLEQVSQLWRENENPKRALELLESAIAINQNDPRLLSTLADLQFENGADDAASETLHRVINRAEEAPVRTAAVDRLLRATKKRTNLQKLAAAERAAIESGSKDRAPYLILSKYYLQERKFTEAQGVLEKLIAFEPSNEDANRQLAKISEDQGDFDVALRHYQSVIDKQPASRRKYLKEMARVYLALYDQEKAFSLYDEILRSSPDNAAAFKEVSDAYLRLNYLDKAADCLQQAVRLKPEEGRYHLALATIYRKQGEFNKAEAEIAAAVKSTDEETAADARKKLYQQWSELGLLEEKIQTLRKKIEDNPYDIESPIILADIYVRELEYQLALDMLDKLLTFQPEEPRLLQTRARMLALMDRPDDSIRDLEKLLKLPKVDRDAITMKIAGAALEAGDLTRAAEVTANIRELDKVSQLYKKYDLMDPAIAAMEKSVAQTPNNPKGHIRLAKLYRQAGKREKAAEMLERALSIMGDDWDVLLLLASVYHELGRKDDAIQSGRRLFYAVRSDAKDDDKDQTANRNSGYSSYYDEWDYSDYKSTLATQALSAIRAFYTQIGALDEYSNIISDEVKQQPRNVDLFQAAMSHFRIQKNAQLAVDAVSIVRDETLGKNRIPKGYSKAEWESSIWRQWRDAHRIDAKIAETRVYTLQELAAKPNFTETDYLELAELLDSQRKEAEGVAAVEAGIQQFPKSVRLLVALATRRDRDKQYDAAADCYKNAAALLPDPDAERAAAERNETAFRKQKDGILNRFPQSVRRKVKSEDLRRIFDLQNYTTFSLDSSPGGRISKEGVLLAHARVLFKSNKKDAGKAVLAQFDGRTEISLVSSVASSFFDHEMHDDAERAYLQLAELGRAVDADPILSYLRPAEATVNSAMSKLARIYEKRNKPFLAYDYLRTYGDANAAELYATTNNLLPSLEEEYRKKLDAASAAADSPENRATLRDAGVKLAEILQIQKKYNDALAIYKSIAPRLPDDFSIRNLISTLLERNEQFDESVAERYAMIERKRELNRIPARDEKAKPREISPIVPKRAAKSNDDWIWNNLQYFRGGSGASAPKYPINEDYTSILRIYLNRKQITKAAQALRDLAREDMSTFRWLAWELGDIVENYQFGAQGLPILKLLYSYEPNEYSVWKNYVKSLISANQLDEAQRILTLQMNRSRSSWEDEELKSLQATLDGKLGSTKKETLDSLRALAEKEPKNIKIRIRLARKLFSERNYKEALEQTKIAESLAPHLDEVSTLTVQCLRATGDYNLLKQKLQKDLSQGNDSEKTLTTAFNLANLNFADGDLAAAEAAIEEGRKRCPSLRQQYSIATWYASKQMDAKALETIDKEMTEQQRSVYANNPLAAKQLKLKLITGDLKGSLDLAWRAVESGATPGERQAAFENFAGTLKLVPKFESVKSTIEGLSKSYGGARGELYLAAAALASGDLAAADSLLASAFASDSKCLYVFPLRLSIARARGDWAKALELVEQIEKLNLSSDSASISTQAGNMTERDTLRSEKGGILIKLGRPEDAKKVLQEIADINKPENRLVLARIYEDHNFLDEAIEMVKGYLERAGERDFWILQQLANLYLKKKNYDQAIAIIQRSKILNKDSNNTVNWQAGTTSVELFDAYSRAGRLPEYLEYLKKKLAAEPGETETLKEITRVGALLNDDAAVISAFEALISKPGADYNIYQSLVNRWFRAGNKAKALETIQKAFTDSTTEWQRQNFARRLADYYIQEKNIEKAVEYSKLAVENPDAPSALHSVADRFMYNKLWAPAIELYEKARAADPSIRNVDLPLSNCYQKVGRHREALDAAFRAVTERESAAQLTSIRPNVLACADAVKEDERVAAELTKDPTNIEFRRRSALLAYFRHRYPEAVSQLTKLLEQTPDDACLLAALAASHDAMDHFAEAVDCYEKLRSVVDRDATANSYYYDFPRFVNNIGLLILRSGKPADAAASIREKMLKSRAPVNLNSYAVYNESDGAASVGEWLARHSYYKESVAELEDTLLRTGRPKQMLVAYIQALYSSGERDRAVSLAWGEVVDPLAELSNANSGGRYYYDEEWTGDQIQQFLISTAKEEGSMDALLDKINKECLARPENASLKKFRKAALASNEQFEPLVKLYIEELDQNPYNTQLLNDVAKCYLKLGRPNDALPFATRMLALQRAQAGATTRTFTGGGRVSAMRFRFSGQTNYNSGYSSYSSGFSGDEIIGASVRLAIIYKKLGKPQDAEQYEREACVPADYRNEAQVYQAVAEQYLEYDLFEDAVRLCTKALALESSSGDDYNYRQLLRIYQKSGIADKTGSAAGKLIEILTKEIAADPYNIQLIIERARARLVEGKDFAAARADAQAILKDFPRMTDALAIVGWCALRENRPADAVAEFQKCENLLRFQDEDFYFSNSRNEVDYGLGLSQAALGKIEIAGPLLRRALAKNPSHPAAPDARKLLN